MTFFQGTQNGLTIQNCSVGGWSRLESWCCKFQQVIPIFWITYNPLCLRHCSIIPSWASVDQYYTAERSVLLQKWWESVTMEETQTIVTLKNVGFSYREIAKRVRVSESTVSFTIKSYSETAAKWQEDVGQTQYHNWIRGQLAAQRTTASSTSLIVVMATKSQLQLWREDFELQVWQD